MHKLLSIAIHCKNVSTHFTVYRQTGVVYGVPGVSRTLAHVVCVGQTGRRLQQRVREHDGAVRKGYTHV